MIQNIVQPKGEVELIISHDNGTQEKFLFKNTVLGKGREALASCLANEIGDAFEFYVDRMIFGSTGTMPNGTPKYVAAERTGLFGSTVLSKPVIASIDPDTKSQVIFTSIVLSSEPSLTTTVLNEMALQMHNGDLYSMVTFPDVSKTSTMQLQFNWRLSYV